METETSDSPRVPYARGYRLRLHLDRVDGPIWLGLLASMGWALGVVRPEAYGLHPEP